MRRTGWFILAAVLVGVFGVCDYVYGIASGIAAIREDARRFRMEAAQLPLATRALVPSLTHYYPDPHRPEGEVFIPPSIPRTFKTTNVGTVATGISTTPTKSTILFLGGSTTECNEVDEEFRFPAVVERTLRAHNTSISTVNAGVRGHTTLDAINSLLNRPELSATADVVVLMENINDRLLLALRDRYGEEPSNVSPTSFAAVWGAAYATVVNAWDYIAYRSNVLFFLKNSEGWFGGGLSTKRGYVTERTLDELPPPSPVSQGLYERNLRVFVSIVRAMEKTPVLVTQPLGKRSPGQELFNNVVRRVAQQTSTLLVDLDATLPDDRGWAYLSDNIHLNNRGSREVGSLLAEALAPRFGTSYKAPAADTGLTSIERLAEDCLPPDVADGSSSFPLLYQILGESGRYPSISSDRRWLLFQTRNGKFDRIRALHLSDRRIFELSPDDARVHERHPAFLNVTSSGFSIVFGHGTSGEYRGHERILVRDWPSGATRPLYPDDTLAGSIPNVVADYVLFAGSNERNRTPNLFRFKRDTGLVERLTDSRAEEWRPAGASSGDIYFISDVGGRFAIYKRATRAGKIERVVESSGDEWDPAVSPDGKWLAFASRRHGSWDIFVVPTTDLSKARRLTNLPGDEWDPAWHPNGRVLIFGSAQFREPTIMALCPFGDKPLKTK